jgi:hypothetical protein
LGKKKFIQATQIKKRGVANGINGFLLEKMGPCGYIIRKNRPMLPYLDNIATGFLNFSTFLSNL